MCASCMAGGRHVHVHAAAPMGYIHCTCTTNLVCRSVPALLSKGHLAETWKHSRNCELCCAVACALLLGQSSIVACSHSVHPGVHCIPAAQEADRAGSLQVDRAKALGVDPGQNFTRLKDGFTVKVGWGGPAIPTEKLGSLRAPRPTFQGRCMQWSPCCNNPFLMLTQTSAGSSMSNISNDALEHANLF